MKHCYSVCLVAAPQALRESDGDVSRVTLHLLRWHAIMHRQVTILSQAFGDPYFQHHAAALASSKRFKDSTSTDRRKLQGNGQSEQEAKGLASRMQPHGASLGCMIMSL